MDRKATLTDCGDCSRWKEVRQRMRISELLTAAMASFEEKEITVTWVEPEERSSAER